MVRPLSDLTIAGRWEHTPRFDGDRISVRDSANATERIEEAVNFDLPSTYAVGATFSSGGTAISGELARTSFSTALLPVLRTAGSGSCNTPKPGCPGWGIANYEAADATTVRGGIEQSISTAGGTLLLRGGVAYQSAYTVARPTSDPWRNDGSLPAPPFLSDEEPPREATSWITGGIAYQWSSYELAFGAGFSQMQTRLLADFRFSL